jgi:SAM-dependent methyltransferase
MENFDYVKMNKDSWNKRVPVHVQSEFYFVEEFLNGKSSLNEIELNLLGDIRGKSILHLQCHFGQDSLSLARMGAEVTGVDLSDAAIEQAKVLNEKLQLNAEFICCDVYDLKNHLDKKFDIVFTSYGTIGWLPDLDRWAEIVSHFLRPGGKFIFAEFHPVMWMFDNEFQTVGYNYFNSGPDIETSTGTYADPTSDIEITCAYWNHSTSEVLTSLLAQGPQLTQFQEFNWKYAPQVYSQSNHPIVKNVGGIKFDFANAIDTLKNGIKKTVLLQSSPYSKRMGTPTEINLNSVNEETSPADYLNKGNIPLAVLLEGKFHSMFENRILAFDQNNFQAKGKTSKMIVISDGDIIKNQLDKNGMPVELGYDQRSGNLYDNKDLLMNCVNYLLDDTGLINIRSKDLDLPLLDKEKVYENYTNIQLLTIGLPIAILGVFGFLFSFLRKRKYSR